MAQDCLAIAGFHGGGAADVGDGVGVVDDAVGAQVDPLPLPRLDHGAEGNDGSACATRNTPPSVDTPTTGLPILQVCPIIILTLIFSMTTPLGCLVGSTATTWSSGRHTPTKIAKEVV